MNKFQQSTLNNMTSEEIKKCKKNGYVWLDNLGIVQRVEKYSCLWPQGTEWGLPSYFATRAAAQAAIDERKRLARLAEYRKSMDPITPEQAKDLHGVDPIFAIEPQAVVERRMDGNDIPHDIGLGVYFWTREAAEAAISIRVRPFSTPEFPRESTRSMEMKPTTVRGWLKTIPDPTIREAAIRQCIKLNDVCSSLDEAIIEIVDWASTDEGIDFWEECFIAAQNNTTWPSYPPKAKEVSCTPYGRRQALINLTKAYMDDTGCGFGTAWAYAKRSLKDGNQKENGRKHDEIDIGPGSKYHRTIHGVSEGTAIVDVYNVLEAFSVTCPACQHAIKKLLCAGLRGKGNRLQDLTEAAASITRAIELEKQRGEGAENERQA